MIECDVAIMWSMQFVSNQTICPEIIYKAVFARENTLKLSFH